MHQIISKYLYIGKDKIGLIDDLAGFDTVKAATIPIS
jgi:hypothetical protein